MNAHPLVAEIANDIQEIVDIRRDIHAHPELGMDEHRTAALVADRLAAWGVEHVTGVGRTGVVASIRGSQPGNRAIGLRCDMDALPIQERTGVAHASVVPGRMHACGHDGHTAMLLGAARYLAANRDFAGTVHLIFQPAEEGGGGALAMLEDGLFERFPCDAVYGMHNRPGIPVGSFSTRKGPMLAGACLWAVVFRGKGGHGGATPHLTQDLSVVLAHFILGLQTIVGRNVPPQDSATISVGGIAGGDVLAGNVMAAEIAVSGTARWFAPPVRAIIETRLRALAEGQAALHGATADVRYNWATVPTVNDADAADAAIAAASTLVSAERVNGNVAATMGGEDFSFMLEKRPGAMIMIGNGRDEDGTVRHLHTPRYDFNDAAIPYGVAYWVQLVRQELRRDRG